MLRYTRIAPCGQRFIRMRVFCSKDYAGETKLKWYTKKLQQLLKLNFMHGEYIIIKFSLIMIIIGFIDGWRKLRIIRSLVLVLLTVTRPTELHTEYAVKCSGGVVPLVVVQAGAATVQRSI